METTFSAETVEFRGCAAHKTGWILYQRGTEHGAYAGPRATSWHRTETGAIAHLRRAHRAGNGTLRIARLV
jgi:hypothetical protein